MLGSRIEELLASEIEANGGFSIIADETRQRQLLLEDEEEDFMDEGIFYIIKYPMFRNRNGFD